MRVHRTRNYTGRRIFPIGIGLSAGGFSPLQLGTSLSAWYDASDLSTLFQDSALTTPAVADADPVGGWKDKSGNGRHMLQATAGQRGTLKLAIQNGLPVVRFDGVDDFVGVAVGAGALNQPAWEFVAFRIVALASGPTNGTVIDGNNTNESRVYIPVPAGGSINIFAGAGVTDTLATATGTAWTVAAFYSGTSSSLQVNNRAIVTGDAGTGTVAGLRSGGDGTQFLNCDILERFRVQGSLTSGTAARARNYLRAKWGTP